MGSKLQELIEAAQKLSPREKLALIHTISGASLPSEASDFWEPKSLEEHIRLQGTPVVNDIAELQADFWPEEETADDLIAFVHRQRSGDRLE
jgi:hypothetical protein